MATEKLTRKSPVPNSDHIFMFQHIINGRITGYYELHIGREVGFSKGIKPHGTIEEAFKNWDEVDIVNYDFKVPGLKVNDVWWFHGDKGQWTAECDTENTYVFTVAYTEYYEWKAFSGGSHEPLLAILDNSGLVVGKTGSIYDKEKS